MCHCVSGAHVPQGHAVWRRPEGERVYRVRLAREKGLEKSQTGVQEKGPYLAALDTLVRASADEQWAAQEVRLHFDAARPLLLLQPRLRLGIESRRCCWRPLEQPWARGAEVTVKSEGRATLRTIEGRLGAALTEEPQG